MATEAIISDFLREIRDITVVSKRSEQQATMKRDVEEVDRFQEHSSMSERAEFIPEHDETDQEASYQDDVNSDAEYRDTGGTVFVLCTEYFGLTFNAAWIPGQGVRIDYTAIVEILIRQLDSDRSCKNLVQFDYN